MTRQEITGIRNLDFSGWVRKYLPDSATGFLVSDLDFVFLDWQKKKLMLLEVKTRNADLKPWQQNLFAHLTRWIGNGIDSGWKFLGFHVLKFENTFFDDGKVWFDGKETDECNLIEDINLMFHKYD